MIYLNPISGAGDYEKLDYHENNSICLRFLLSFYLQQDRKF